MKTRFHHANAGLSLPAGRSLTLPPAGRRCRAAGVFKARFANRRRQTSRFALPQSGQCLDASLPARGIAFVLIVLSLMIALHAPAQSAAGPAAAPAEPRPLRVLMIFGTLGDSPGSLMMEQAVRTEMIRGCTNRIEFLTENLDVYHFSDPDHFKLFQNYLANKYAGQKLDLVLTFPSRDYRLASDLPHALFPGVPVVFVAVNEMDVPWEIQKLGVTGIVQRYDLTGTLGLILRLQPDTRQVLVVGGASVADQALMKQVEEVAQSTEEVKFKFFTNRPVAELPEAARSLPPDTVVLLGSVQRDVTGRHYFVSQLSEMLATTAGVPVYVLGGSAIGNGAIGGVVVDPEELGGQAARLALRVLGGVRPETVPIEIFAKGTPMLDWRALKRWGISESRVPADGIIRYRPETLWEEHRGLILFLLVIFVLQSATIGGLMVQRRHRRLAEQEVLRQQTELAHVTRVATMGQFASAIAHELNQPLGAILRNTEAAEIFLRQEKPDLEEIRGILTDIRNDDERAGRVIERMRALLRYRSLETRPVELHALILETVALARPAAEARQVRVALQIPEKLPAVLGDPVQLQQVILNLILNGMDAMNQLPPAERKLTVQAQTAGKGTVEVAVGDSGTGIPPADLPRLFESFFTTKPDGMGMGLAISQTIIEAHGGKIRGGNQDSRGAIFKFSLPAQPAET